MMNETAKELLQFLKKSPTAFHAVKTIGEKLAEAGYTRLSEKERWDLRQGGCYYVTRNDSSVIAFRLPAADFRGYQIMASHSDSPAFKLKDQPEMSVEGHYVKLNVEKYGGMLMAPWFDRPLSAAGRVMVKTAEGKIESRLVDLDRDLLMIPSLAIHMNREVNDGYKYNPQKDMLPLFSCDPETGAFTRLVEEAAGASGEDILSADLFLYSRCEGSIWGGNEEFISCGRLDDLQCSFAGLKGFLQAEPSERFVPVYAVLDNEEVGSTTKQGAASTLLKDVMERINAAAGRSREDFLCALAGSFMVSADNAHAVHPNYADKTDPTNRPYVNGGIVIKHSANQKYTTDAVSDAVFRQICEKAGVKVQSFFNRSDIAGGSTLGNIANTQTPMNTVDIGLPQLAMHSPYETAGVKDTEDLVKAAERFYSICVSDMID